MARTFRIRARLLARVAAPLLFAAALSACSSMPDWADPGSWMGGDNQVSSDQSGNPGSDNGEAANSGESTAGQTPDLATIPPKPAAPSTAEEQKQVADSLIADRADAHYSAEALKGGSEPTAPPPPPAAPAAAPPAGNSVAAVSPHDQSGTEAANPAAEPAAGSDTSTSEPAAAPAPESGTAPSGAASDTAASMAPSSSGEATGAAENSGATASSSANVNQVANTAPAEAAAPSAPETASAAPDTQTTFAPSKAPPLDPSVARYVPAPILLRYHQTAAQDAAPGAGDEEGAAAVPSKHHHRHHKKPKASELVRHHARHFAWIRLHKRRLASRRQQGLRVAALRAKPMRLAAAEPVAAVPALTPASWEESADPQSLRALSSLVAPSSRRAVAVVAFPDVSERLDSFARSRIRAAARAFAARGRVGFVRVVGHSATAPPDLSRTARRKVDLVRSEAQATTVARELIRDGVPPERIMVEADGAGGHGRSHAHRNAEIFLQS